MKIKPILIFGATLFACLGMHAVAGTVSATPGKFGAQWKDLLGEWAGENALGKRSGACGFRFGLSEHVIIRTNHAELLAGGGAHAASHDDLMVIYPGLAADKAKAVYFDNEGHMIEYDAEWSADGNTLTFLSKPGVGPQFRLTYKKLDPKTFSVTFEMIPPGQASFKPYTSGIIRRTGSR